MEPLLKSYLGNSLHLLGELSCLPMLSLSQPLALLSNPVHCLADCMDVLQVMQRRQACRCSLSGG